MTYRFLQLLDDYGTHCWDGKYIDFGEYALSWLFTPRTASHSSSTEQILLSNLHLGPWVTVNTLGRSLWVIIGPVSKKGLLLISCRVSYCSAFFFHAAHFLNFDFNLTFQILSCNRRKNKWLLNSWNIDSKASYHPVFLSLFLRFFVSWLQDTPIPPSLIHSVLLKSNCYDDAISQHFRKILHMVSLLSSRTDMMVSFSKIPRWRQNKGLNILGSII